MNAFGYLITIYIYMDKILIIIYECLDYVLIRSFKFDLTI